MGGGRGREREGEGRGGEGRGGWGGKREESPGEGGGRRGRGREKYEEEEGRVPLRNFISPALKGVGNTLKTTCKLCGHGVPEVLVIVNVAIPQPDKQSAPLHEGLFKKHWLQGRV